MPNIPYNLTELNNAENLYDLTTQANTLAGGLIGILSLIVLFVIVFMGLKQYESKNAFAAASYVTAMIAILLRLMVWISDTVMFTSFILVGISLVWLRLD